MKTSWIETYWTLMAASDFDNAIPIKEQHFPLSFFKYRAPNVNTINMITDNYLWLADIATLNDPFEGLIQFDNDECLRAYYTSPLSQQQFTALTGQQLTTIEVQLLSTAEKPYKEYIRICKQRNIPFGFTEEQLLERIQRRWKEIVEERNRHLRICSFSLINNSTLMWSHYAGEHKGICIEYDFLDENSIRPFLQPVLYRDKLHKIGLFEEYDTMQMIAANLIKSNPWSYEEEWRLTIFRRADNFPRILQAPKPIAIYLGTRFNENDEEFKQRIIQLAQQREISVFQMTKNPHGFELVKSEKLVI